MGLREIPLDGSGKSGHFRPGLCRRRSLSMELRFRGRTQVSRLAPLFMILAFGCRPSEVREADGARPVPDRWILVDRPYSELAEHAKAGCAEVRGSSRAWVLEPVFDTPAYFPHGLRIVYSRPRRYEVDEIVEVDVAVEGCESQAHIVEVLPTKRSIRLLTPERIEIAPGGRATIRFLAGSPGPGGVTIRVARCGLAEMNNSK